MLIIITIFIVRGRHLNWSEMGTKNLCASIYCCNLVLLQCSDNLFRYENMTWYNVMETICLLGVRLNSGKNKRGEIPVCGGCMGGRLR